MDKKKTTRELMNVLQNVKNGRELGDYVRGIDASPPPESFAELFRSLEKVQTADKARLIADANIERTYFYQLLNGTRKPGRDKLLLLCLVRDKSLRCVQLLATLLQFPGQVPDGGLIRMHSGHMIAALHI